MRFEFEPQDLQIINMLIGFYASKNQSNLDIQRLTNKMNEQIKKNSGVINLVEDKETGVWGLPKKVSTIHKSTSGKGE